MKEMLIVGRGGQGVVLASQLLADTFARAGFFVQSFPEFKAERRGAPISAFLRWDDEPVRRRYKVRDCDVLVSISSSPPPPETSARPSGRADRPEPRHALRAHRPVRIARVPASTIARRNGVLSSEGRPMGNVAVLGACVRLLLPTGSSSSSRRSSSGWARWPRRTSSPPARASAGSSSQHQTAGDTPVEPAPAARAAAAGTSSSRQHDRLARQPHGLVVARPAGPHRRLHGLRAVRLVLPRGRARPARPRDRRRLPLLQGLRDLRGRLPGPGRDRHGGGAGREPGRLPRGRVVMTANEAAAYAVVLARAQAIGCYPITPQTLIVEKLAELLAGREDVEYANLESEHSMLGYVIAAARTGVRTFTATSSQGLLYAHEQLHRASRERTPLVMVNVNRSVLAPWSLEPDLSDSMSQRDTGWIQLYCSSGQEVLDTVLCAYRIAETVHAASDGLPRGLPALAHVRDRRRPRPGGGGRVPPAVQPAGRVAPRPERGARLLRAPGAQGLRRLPAQRRGRDGRGPAA